MKLVLCRALLRNWVLSESPPFTWFFATPFSVPRLFEHDASHVICNLNWNHKIGVEVWYKFWRIVISHCPIPTCSYNFAAYISLKIYFTQLIRAQDEMHIPIIKLGPKWRWAQKLVPRDYKRESTLCKLKFLTSMDSNAQPWSSSNFIL